MPAEQPGFVVEEHYSYSVELGRYPLVEWLAEASYGELRACVPYDGARLPRTAEAAEIALGELHTATTEGQRGETLLPIRLPAGKRWETLLKSGRQALIGGRYAVDEPVEPLFSIQAAVTDRPIDRQDLILNDMRGFESTLQLVIDLWVPDLIEQMRPSEADELDLLLLRRENARQILIGRLRSGDSQLAQALAALANSQGGSVVLGVESDGNVLGIDGTPGGFASLVKAVVRASLQATPPVPIARLRRLRHSSGKDVAVVELPSAPHADYLIDGRRYRRDGASTISEAASAAAQSPGIPAGQTLPHPTLREFLEQADDQPGRLRRRANARTADSLILLDASAPNLAGYICGLLNSRHGGHIVAVNLPGGGAAAEGRSLWQLLRAFLIGPPDRRADFDKLLKAQCAALLPEFAPAVAHDTVAGLPVAVVHVPSLAALPGAPPVALFRDEAYEWRDGQLEQLSAEDLLTRLRARQTDRPRDRSGDQSVYLDGGALQRPIRPPESIWQDKWRADGNRSADSGVQPTFDVQHQTNRWDVTQFAADPATFGHRLRLGAPLQYASLDLDATGRAAVVVPQLTGQLHIRLNDVSASGMSVGVKATSKQHAWLAELPIVKRTYLHLSLQIPVTELYERRTGSSLLCCVFPNVALDAARVRDVEKVCEDLGFRMASRQQGVGNAVLQGLRSADYHDLTLLVGLIESRQEADREVKHIHHTDRRTMRLPTLEVRLILAGVEEAIDSPLGAEIKRLQIAFFRTLRDRLCYLGVE